MDGKEALYRLRLLLDETTGAGFLDDRTSYSYLWDAATEFATRSESLKSSQAITTVASTTAYVLNADFMHLYMKDDSGNLFVKYYDGTTYRFINFEPYSSIIHDNQTTAVTIPSRFTIIDKPALYSRVTGTATSAGAASGGEATLTDTAADFSNVNEGDTIHNTTDRSDGYVLSKTSSTVIVTALFGGSGNDWASSDAYTIQPQGRLQLVLDPPPSTAGHTVTVEYVQRPMPVFSDYGIYRFQTQYMDAIVKYAAFIYRYKDQEPDFGNAFFQLFDRSARQNKYSTDKSLVRTGLSVNLKKRA